MHEADPRMKAVAAAVGAPDLILPWLDRFYDEADAELILAAGGEHGASLGGASEERLARAVRRAVLDVDEAGAHAAADFHERLEIWAMFEGWKDVPLAVHRQLADWDVDYYADKIRAGVEEVRDGHPGDSYEARYSYVLLGRRRRSSPPRTTSTCGRVTAAPWSASAASRWTSACASRTVAASAGRSPGSAPPRSCAPPTRPASCTRPTSRTTSPAPRPSATAAPTAATRTSPPSGWRSRSSGRCAGTSPASTWSSARTAGAVACAARSRPSCAAWAADPEFDAALCRGCGLCATGCSTDAIEMLPLTAV